ncbi:NADP-dependent dehydrogenase-like protein [Thermothelomyces thermophilus ATCC 42464]|uniref:NADP-dependent dehydrogenase-like protein n=1 Tax=Thermothelomyces thermophilus (strain ATCC 42464 / BCRC 31852 / DSM 1799) TaxID=573729 RepID=G2QIV3_THET4|nr:NADP-dependent dehydrogenase-like protein [Thermothelomyces thermophilus ATCC 42464]AEO59581.1 NADP-dependent dehydrogenase-like protein [Thermothelomyces thermophilus ATCC 42464]
MPVYVITGTRAGIGLEHVRQLSQAASNTVFALVRSAAGDLATLKSIQQTAAAKVHILECDVSSESSIAALPDRIREASGDANIKINTLINNAAVLHAREQTALTLTPAALNDHMRSNLLGPALVLQALLPLLAPGARVANISSGAGSLTLLATGRITPEITPYSLSKAALNMLTVHQQAQLRARSGGGGSGIVVVAVDPGHVKTEMGGPNAVVEVEDSARAVLKLVEGLTERDGGKFWLYNGEELPW